MPSMEWLIEPKGRLPIVLAAGVLVLSVSAGINVLLAHRLQDSIRDRAQARKERLAQVGAAVRPLQVRALDGKPEEIRYVGSHLPTVLYIFTPLCKWCLRNKESVGALIEQKKSEFRFIGISLTENGLSEYVRTNQMPIPVYTVLSTDWFLDYKPAGTPQTIVISPEGRVLQNWIGVYVGEQQKQVEEFFHVKLPGLKSAPAPSSAGRAESSSPKALDQQSN